MIAQDLRVSVVVPVRDQLAAARNRAARAARASNLAFTDADCLPEPDWLENGLIELESADLVAGEIRSIVPHPTVDHAGPFLNRVWRRTSCSEQRGTERVLPRLWAS